jgi:hypothetical protein
MGLACVDGSRFEKWFAAVAVGVGISVLIVLGLILLLVYKWSQIAP